MPKPTPWEDAGWEFGEQLSGGNQAHTFLARRKSDPSREYNFVLKRLKRQEDLSRRRRMHIEAQSLRALDSDNVSRLICTNSEKFEDPKVPLYVVTERIHGTPLDALQPLPTDLETAYAIVRRVVETLKQCHSLQICHRDIKPCHVILRNGLIESPVLIDFGLAFNFDSAPTEKLTELGEGVGNRFIIMPEQLYGIDKSDPRSDLTQCVGLLYFLVIGHAPGIILDTNQQKPHEKNNLGSIILAASSAQVRQLKRIFDIGFSHSLDGRWQTHDALIAELDVLVAATDEQPIDFSSSIRNLVQQIREKPENNLASTAEVCLEALSRKVQECFSFVHSHCDELITMSLAQTALTRGTTRKWTLQVQRKMGEHQPELVNLDVQRQGAELSARMEVTPFLHFGHPTERPMQVLHETRFGVMDPESVRLGIRFVEKAFESLVSYFGDI